MAETIKIPQTIVVRDFATKLGLSVTAVTAELIKNGIMASLNQEIDFDTAVIIAEDLGRQVEPEDGEVKEATTTQTITDYLQEDPKAKLVARPPVVVVMGHVDHGKTSLLDAIRTTNVTGGEAGGITQHIGAYQVTQQNRLMTFIDTPGHEAFTQMRARGAKIADVAILVIAGDDGFKPQTEEALKLIQDAKLPYIVAITKVDKPDAQIERVKKELAEHEVLVEGYGGTIPVVGVSAKEQTGIHELLESVLLLGDLEQDLLKVNPDRDAVGTIIESHVDPQQGPIASVLVQTGTLKIGDPVVVGQVWGKIRSMKNDRGEVIKVARPSMPAQILGLKAAPQVGDILRVSEAESTELKKKVKSHQMGHHLQSVVGRRPTVIKKKGEDEEEEKKPELRKHLIILKTDTLGSSEAILESIKKFEHQEVSVEIVQRGLGIVTETDVLRAEAAKATIYAFHVPVSPKAEQLARSKNLVIRSYKVIYDLLDEIKLQLEALLPELQEVKEIGRLKVLAVFRNENTFQVVGGKVISGEIQLNANVSVTRKSQEIAKGTITQLQVNKQNVQRAAEGNECGMKVEGQTVIQVGDELVASIIEVQKRTLTP